MVDGTGNGQTDSEYRPGCRGIELGEEFPQHLQGVVDLIVDREAFFLVDKDLVGDVDHHAADVSETELEADRASAPGIDCELAAWSATPVGWQVTLDE